MSTVKDSKRIRSGKRILSVTIRRMLDDSPDSSYLGEYGSQPKSDYAIDRAHSEDCIENDSIQKDKLERIADAIENDRPFCNDHSEQYDCDCNDCQEEKAYTEALEQIRELAECDCSSSGHWSAREYRYFNPNHENYKGLPEDEIRKYCRHDFDRMERLNNGSWCYIVIRAEAQIQTGSDVEQDITSGGLCGTESHADVKHIEQ